MNQSKTKALNRRRYSGLAIRNQRGFRLASVLVLIGLSWIVTNLYRVLSGQVQAFEALPPMIVLVMGGVFMAVLYDPRGA
jgi:hypothetical protein